MWEVPKVRGKDEAKMNKKQREAREKVKKKAEKHREKKKANRLKLRKASYEEMLWRRTKLEG